MKSRARKDLFLGIGYLQLRRFQVVLMMCIVAATSFAQELKGKLISVTGEPIISGYLICNEKNIHTHSDHNGLFIFKDIRPGDTLEVSHIGYVNYSRVITSQDFDGPIDISIEEDFFALEQVSVSNDLRNAYDVTAIDLQLNPVSSSQQVLRSVPGLFIGQHAGGGKAEQIFLRGFDIDHGTDITMTVDGMPVNMVSHAHGQGYADLHFVIPETIENIDFGKGPYYADKGNFNTAGYVNFKTKEKVDESSVGVEYGQFNTMRMYGIVDLLGKESKDNNAYLATEYLLSDGPFESDQNFNRFNVMGKYNKSFGNNNKLSVQYSRFQSKWDASGQIPQRLVDDGTLTRFGAVDDTEGGNTSRTNLAVSLTKNLSATSFVSLKSYLVNYDFELFSNFTFFLNDSINGDQIRQYEKRSIYGLESRYFQSIAFHHFTLNANGGIGFRYDDIDENQLSYTTNRTTLRQRLAYGNIDENNLFAFANLEFDFGKWLINPSVRVDHFVFNYNDNLSTQYETLSESSTVVTPNLNVIFNPNRHVQLFVKSGFGYHSNDARVVVAQAGQSILPLAFGLDVGTVWKPFDRFWFSAALWHLYLAQEFVYVGDEAIVEPSGQTKRRGVEMGLRYQIADELFAHTDLTYTHARSIENSESNQFIPLAPVITASGGLTYKSRKGFDAALKYRFIQDRPANENNSIIAMGYMIVDANLGYRFRNITFGVAIENLLDSEWNEAQFATLSQLKNENAPVEELHFTPGTPFSLRGRVSYSF